MESENTRLIVPVSENDHVLGPLDAPVTLVEYGDYQCSYCGEAYTVLNSVLRSLGDQVRFVFRNFPIGSIHPDAERAAEAAEAAGAQGQFWEMHDALYENQDDLSIENILSIAQGLGLDTDALMGAIERQEFKSRIRHDFMSGVRSGVNGTPAFFINGKRYDGVWWDERVFEQALRGAGERRLKRRAS